MKEIEALIRYWQKVIENGPSYVSPNDREILGSAKWKKKMKLRLFKTTQSFVESEFVLDHRHIIHEGLLPAPYVGDLSKASVILFLLNPGFGPADYKAEEDQVFREAVTCNVLQKLEHLDYPFCFLDPRLSWTGGYAWWAKKLHPVAAAVKERMGSTCTFEDALKMVSRKVAAIEVFPYHSSTLPISGEMLQKLESVQLVGDLAKSLYLKRDRLLVFTRSVHTWSQLIDAKLTIPDEIDQRSNPIVYPSRYARSASLSPIKNTVVDRILAQ